MIIAGFGVAPERRRRQSEKGIPTPAAESDEETRFSRVQAHSRMFPLCPLVEELPRGRRAAQRTRLDACLSSLSQQITGLDPVEPHACTESLVSTPDRPVALCLPFELETRSLSEPPSG